MKRRKKWILLIVFIFQALNFDPVFARLTPEQLPPDLAPWRNWAIYGHESELCPQRFDDPTITRCQWPTRLQLDIADDGARFEQHAYVFTPEWIVLPGGGGAWPDGVTLDGQAAVVIPHDGSPAIHAPVGEHHIQGRFFWRRIPDDLLLPPSLGLLSISHNGIADEASPIIDQNRLLLNAKPRPQREENLVRVHIFRLFRDTIPMEVITVMKVDVFGEPREIGLAGGVPDDGIAMMVDSPLPAHLDEKNQLTLQARPGRWEIRIRARLTGMRSRIEAGALPNGPEIWSFEPQHHLRMVEVTGLARVEPSQTDMPKAWQSFSAFAVAAGDVMTLKELRRGNPDPPPDQLRLTRTWWLDFKGTGFTIHDTVRGTINRHWSLAYNPPGVLGRVAVDGQNQVITVQEGTRKAGVELRSGELRLAADSQIPFGSNPLNIVGWDADFQQVTGQLQLPPGWRLLAATGIDAISDTWLQDWTLLDFFLVLIIVVAVFKLRNWKWGLTALILMVLIFQEPGAPRLVWLHLLAVSALLAHLPAGWFRRIVMLWGMVAVVVLVLLAVPFIMNQIRWGIYPQLAPSDYSHGPGQWGLFKESPPSALDAATERPGESDGSAPERREKAAAAPSRLMSDLKKPPLAPASAPAASGSTTPNFGPAPDALIPTGPGLPQWRWQTIRLGWSGPLSKDQTMRLYFLSPAANLVIGLLRVILLIVFAVGFFHWRPWWWKMKQVLRTSALVVATILIVGHIPVARAQETMTGFPPQSLLEELGRRLLEKPDCKDACADISRMEINITGDRLVIMLKTQAVVQAALPLPVNKNTWLPSQVFMDNAPAGALAGEKDGQLWTMAPSGVHTMILSGRIDRLEMVELPMVLKPHQVSVMAPGWDVRGLLADGTAAATIQLIRMQSDREPVSNRGASRIAPFFQIERHLQLGLTWQVTTEVRRLTPLGAPAVLQIPLLTGEAVTTPGVSVAGDKAEVHFTPDQPSTVYTATLPISNQVVLTAPRAVPWVEIWRLDAATIWHYETSGIAAVQIQNPNGRHQPIWQPWPGESVTIQIDHPPAMAGRTRTIDRTDLIITPGHRFTTGELTLQIRSSQGGPHTFTLPTNANLQSVTLNNQPLPVRQEGPLVTIPLQPGAQTVQMQWHQPTAFSWNYKSPAVDVGQEGVNARLTVNMPHDRWTLITFGPRWGPAVLFWSHLIALLAMAIVLGRLPLTRLRTPHWLLLALGLTQIPLGMALVIVGWLFSLGMRERLSMPNHWLPFNAIQFVLVLWTLAALFCLFAAVKAGLIGQPQMHITGNESTHLVLNWTVDRMDGLLPRARVVSLSIWVYRGLMLVWSLWLALSLVGWLKWGWQCFSRQRLWAKARRRIRQSRSPETVESGSPPIS